MGKQIGQIGNYTPSTIFLLYLKKKEFMYQMDQIRNYTPSTIFLLFKKKERVYVSPIF